MNVAEDSVADTSIREILKRAESLQQFLIQSVAEGKSLHEIERGVFDQLLSMGRHAIDAVLQLQETGDLGAVYVESEGRELQRSAVLL